MDRHPTKEELSGFMLGKLPAETCDEVADHLEHCPPCQNTIQALEEGEDTLLLDLRRAPPASVEASDPKCEQAVEQAAKLLLPAVSKSEDASAGTSSAPNNAAPRAPTREQFIATLLASGLMTPEEWKKLQRDVPAIAEAADGATLGQTLVKRGVLTKLQASAIYRGKSKGLVFGEHVLLELLGEGGMGQVFKARHRSMDRIVALKVLAKKAVNSPDAVLRFQREVKAVAKLHHPNIVTAFDASRQEGVHYLVMEYVEGIDLAALVQRDGPLSIDAVVSYIAQTARGLAFAHAEGVVHRDIKPANLLLDKKGTVKILDMGLARLESEAAARDAGEGLTQTGQVMGTVDYMAPEQAFDTSRADGKADVYSLGCTLYRLATNKNMFGGDTVVQKLLAHREQPAPSLRASRPDTPAVLDAIYLRMVAKRPEERPTMSELISQLEALSKHAQSVSEIVVEPTSAFELPPELEMAVAPKPSSPVRRPPTRTLIAAGAAAFFLIVALGVWVIVRDREGNEIGRFKKPDGGTITIQDDATEKTPVQAAATAEKTTPEADAVDADRSVMERLVPFELSVVGVEDENGKAEWFNGPLEPPKVTAPFAIKHLRISTLEKPLPNDLLEQMGRLKAVDSLQFGFMQMNGETASAISRWRSLRNLQIWNTNVTDKHLEKLTTLPNVESLTVASTMVTDEGLRLVAQMKTLKYLGICSSHVRGNGLEHLKTLPKLEHIWLGGGEFEGDALKHLSGFQTLRTLHIGNPGEMSPQINDHCIPDLLSLKQLTTLKIEKTEITPDGFEKLKAGLPGCKIEIVKQP